MSKRVWTHTFSRKRWRLLDGGLNILLEFEADTGRTERLTVTIHEDRLIVPTGLAPQQGSEEIYRFRP